MNDYPYRSGTSADMYGRQASRTGLTTGAATTFLGAMTANPAFLISGLIQLGGGILSTMFGRRHKQPRTAQEIYFEKMVDFYSNLGKQSRMSSSIASMVTGKPVENTYSFSDAWKKNGIPESIYEEA